jgi:hypothetical protein
MVRKVTFQLIEVDVKHLQIFALADSIRENANQSIPRKMNFTKSPVINGQPMPCFQWLLTTPVILTYPLLPTKLFEHHHHSPLFDGSNILLSPFFTLTGLEGPGEGNVLLQTELHELLRQFLALLNDYSRFASNDNDKNYDDGDDSDMMMMMMMTIMMI